MGTRVPCLVLAASCGVASVAVATPGDLLAQLRDGHARRLAGEPVVELAAETEGLVCVVMPPDSPVPVDWLFQAPPSSVLRVTCDDAGIAALDRAVNVEGATALVVVGVDEEDARLTLEGLRFESPTLDAACEDGRLAAATAVLRPGEVHLRWQETIFAEPPALPLDAQLAAAVQEVRASQSAEPPAVEAAVQPSYHPADRLGERLVERVSPTAAIAAPVAGTGVGIGGVIVFLCGAIASCLILLAGLNGRLPRAAAVVERLRDFLPRALPAGSYGAMAMSREFVPVPPSEDLSGAVNRLEAKLRQWRSDWRAMRDGLCTDLDGADAAVAETDTAARAAVEAAAELRESVGQWAGDESATRDIVRRLGDLSAQAKVLASSAAGGRMRKVADDCFTTVGELAQAMRGRPDPNAATTAADDVQRHASAARTSLGGVTAATATARDRLYGRVN